MSVNVKLDDLLTAFEWVSASGSLEDSALISKETGSIYLRSDDYELEDELPEDLDDPSIYVSVPHKNDLDLGKWLAIRYVDEALSDYASTVREIFRKKGAYAKFKNLLDRKGHLDKWYSYESKAVEKALRAWAEENGIHVVS
ncbi:MAG: hypothetical protein F9K25_10610 [Candidatus Contendobacter sp.]|nr:MAG: hypothetical protein F9K25_10610 [Candidatus Contendobacter sp.]